eukprot:6340817-Amphidinium_carterae.1
MSCILTTALLLEVTTDSMKDHRVVCYQVKLFETYNRNAQKPIERQPQCVKITPRRSGRY